MPPPNAPVDEATRRTARLEELRRGLASTPKWTSPAWFYDAVGGELFDQITRLPEYYPTRTERSILSACAGELAALVRPRTIVELGAGTSDKTRLLLEACLAEVDGLTFAPIDLDEATLGAACESLAAEFDDLDLAPMIADFHELDRVRDRPGPRLVVFLGSTIGNLDPSARTRFLFDLDCSLDRGEGDHALIGFDLVKDRERLVDAYDDLQGVTAAFNLNLLDVLNRETGADFDRTSFRHVAVWDDANNWIEMRLRAIRAMTVRLPAIDLTIGFAQGEELRTEISTKFTPEGVRSELEATGLVIVREWTDAAGDFLVVLARPYC